MSPNTSPPAATVATAMAAAEAGGPRDNAVLESVEERGITEVVHFTTNLGLIGVLGSGLLLSRARLPEERYLEHVYKPNSSIRKDRAWLDFVNLSITQVNDWMFSTSERWHADEEAWWAVLSFDPAILAEPGVVFTTTNNIYPSVRRYRGAEGLAELFAPEVLGRYSTRHTREGLDDNQPTDRQAEVLYPKAIATSALRTVYVRQDEHRDAVAGIFGGLPAAVEVPVIVRSEVFA